MSTLISDRTTAGIKDNEAYHENYKEIFVPVMLLIGALLFSLGIFAIVTYEMRLFTGMVADIPEMKLKNIWKLPTENWLLPPPSASTVSG